jgi:outer membrane protein OmpA-like peptidoglycan-associated protein
MRSLALLVATCAVVAPAAVSANRAAPHRSNTLADVHFRFDSSALPDNTASLIRPAVAYAARHAGARIVVDAHCDPIGASPYNAGLAVRRAESVRAALTKAGVPAEQIVLAVYGEDGPRRASYADDRRVTLWWTRRPIAEVAGHTLALRGTAVEWGQPLTTAQIEAPPQPVASAQRTGTPVASRK